MAIDIDWSHKTVLIVEDEEVNRFYFQTALKSTNINIIFAHNGIDAVKFALENDQIDVILMDIRLPGIDGYEATQRIREVKKTVPIIAQTAYAMTNERDKVFEVGCDDYLAKPIRLNVLYDTLKKYIGD